MTIDRKTLIETRVNSIFRNLHTPGQSEGAKKKFDELLNGLQSDEEREFAKNVLDRLEKEYGEK